MKRRLILASAITVMATVFAAWLGISARAQDPQVEIAVVTHGQASDPFWTVVRNGINEAARETGTRVSYRAPDVYDARRMRDLIDAVVTSRPDGLVVSIPDAQVLAPALGRAKKAGIPVLAINAGADSYRRLGGLVFVGQAEYDAGFAAGRRMAAAGVRNAICVQHQPGVAVLDQRCRRFAAGLARRGGKTRVVAVRLQNQRDAVRRISDALAARSVDGILTLGPGGATPALAALRATRRLGKVDFGTFDLAPDILRAVRAGHILFAIDQQPFLQGYLPVVLLTQYERYGLLPAAGSHLKTGPHFVTKREAARVLRLTRQGIR
jgi:simple sugar transport system substrate-binding protein